MPMIIRPVDRGPDVAGGSGARAHGFGYVVCFYRIRATRARISAGLMGA